MGRPRISRRSPHSYTRSPHDTAEDVLCALSGVRPGTAAPTQAGESYPPAFRSGKSLLEVPSARRPSGEEPKTAAVTQELDHAWARIATELRRTVTDSTYAIWLDPLRPVGLDGDAITVSAPDELRTWVKDRYGPVLHRAARAALRPDARVEIVAPGAAPAAPRGPAAAPTPPARAFNERL